MSRRKRVEEHTFSNGVKVLLMDDGSVYVKAKGMKYGLKRMFAGDSGTNVHLSPAREGENNGA